MNPLGNRYCCMFGTCWKRCCYKKRNNQNHSKKHRYIHSHKMIRSVYNEWCNKATMTMISIIWSMRLSFIISFKRALGKHYFMNYNKCKCNRNNERKCNNIKKLHWLMLRQLDCKSLMFKWFAFLQWMILKCKWWWLCCWTMKPFLVCRPCLQFQKFNDLWMSLYSFWMTMSSTNQSIWPLHQQWCNWYKSMICKKLLLFKNNVFRKKLNDMRCLR